MTSKGVMSYISLHPLQSASVENRRQMQNSDNWLAQHDQSRAAFLEDCRDFSQTIAEAQGVCESANRVELAQKLGRLAETFVNECEKRLEKIKEFAVSEVASVCSAAREMGVTPDEAAWVRQHDPFRLSSCTPNEGL